MKNSEKFLKEFINFQYRTLKDSKLFTYAMNRLSRDKESFVFGTADLPSTYHTVVDKFIFNTHRRNNEPIKASFEILRALSSKNFEIFFEKKGLTNTSKELGLFLIRREVDYLNGFYNRNDITKCLTIQEREFVKKIIDRFYTDKGITRPKIYDYI